MRREEEGENKIGKSLERMRSSVKYRDWNLARESSTEILDFDEKNWYGLIVNAKSNAALGDWHNAAEKWSVIRDLREMSEEEEYESARTLYNSKRFEDIIEKSKITGGGVRTFYHGGHPFTYGPRHFIGPEENMPAFEFLNKTKVGTELI